MNFSHRTRTGFTLVEMMLYISLTSVLLVGLMQSMISVLEHDETSSSREVVQQQLRVVMEQMTQDIRAAKALNSEYSQFMNTNGALGLQFNASGKNPTVYKLIDGRVLRREGLGVWQAVSSDKVKVTKLHFARLTKGGSAAIGITITGVDPFVTDGFLVPKEVTVRNVVNIRQRFSRTDPRLIFGEKFYSSFPQDPLFGISSFSGSSLSSSSVASSPAPSSTPPSSSVGSSASAFSSSSSPCSSSSAIVSSSMAATSSSSSSTPASSSVFTSSASSPPPPASSSIATSSVSSPPPPASSSIATSSSSAVAFDYTSPVFTAYLLAQVGSSSSMTTSSSSFSSGISSSMTTSSSSFFSGISSSMTTSASSFSSAISSSMTSSSNPCPPPASSSSLVSSAVCPAGYTCTTDTDCSGYAGGLGPDCGIGQVCCGTTVNTCTQYAQGCSGVDDGCQSGTCSGSGDSCTCGEPETCCSRADTLEITLSNEMNCAPLTGKQFLINREDGLSVDPAYPDGWNGSITYTVGSDTWTMEVDAFNMCMEDWRLDVECSGPSTHKETFYGEENACNVSPRIEGVIGMTDVCGCTGDGEFTIIIERQ